MLFADLPQEVQWDKLLLFFSLTCSWFGLCLSGKLPELRLIWDSFDFKATLSLHTMLPFHAAFPFPLLDSPPPEILTSSLASYGACQTVLPGVSWPFSMHSSSCPFTEGLNRQFSPLIEGALPLMWADAAFLFTSSHWVAALSSSRGIKDKEFGVKRQLGNSNENLWISPILSRAHLLFRALTI